MRRLKETEFDAFFELLSNSFPTDEYRPYAEQKALLQHPAYVVYTLWDAQGLLAAIACWEFEDICYAEHFAVRASARNRGVGGEMFRAFLEMYDHPVCLEVELPTDDLTRRRIAFYERCGLYFHHFPYMQPPISHDKNPVPLRLMTNCKDIRPQTLLCIKRMLYRQVYRCREDLYESENGYV